MYTDIGKLALLLAVKKKPGNINEAQMNKFTTFTKTIFMGMFRSLGRVFYPIAEMADYSMATSLYVLLSILQVLALTASPVLIVGGFISSLKVGISKLFRKNVSDSEHQANIQRLMKIKSDLGNKNSTSDLFKQIKNLKNQITSDYDEQKKYSSSASNRLVEELRNRSLSKYDSADKVASYTKLIDSLINYMKMDAGSLKQNIKQSFFAAKMAFRSEDKHIGVHDQYRNGTVNNKGKRLYTLISSLSKQVESNVNSSNERTRLLKK